MRDIERAADGFLLERFDDITFASDIFLACAIYMDDGDSPTNRVIIKKARRRCSFYTAVRFDFFSINFFSSFIHTFTGGQYSP